MSTPLPDRLIVSLHVPKTAGTAFADVLTQNYGSAVAFAYGPDHPKTHPLLRQLPASIPAETIAKLEQEGVRVVHGHFSAHRYLEAVPDPARYWMWLRDPVERMISEYYFNRGRDDAENPQVAQIREENLSLGDYAAKTRTRNLHKHLLGPLKIEELGFVGISEFFDECLALTGLAPLPKKTRLRNVTRNKEPVDIDTRRVIARNNIIDIALYSAALQRVLADRRAASDTPAPAETSAGGLLGRLLDRGPRQS